jgi:hypothetical protein
MLRPLLVFGSLRTKDEGLSSCGAGDGLCESGQSVLS